MIFRHFLLGVNEANAFVVACEATREALLVDAGDFDPAMEEFLDTHRLRLAQVFITHNHYDHTGGLPEVMRQHRPAVLAASATVEGVKTRRVKHGDTVSVGTLTGTVLATPGHTPDALSLAFPGHVFTGDALFAGSIGGTSSETLRRQEIDGVRKHIFSLPPDCAIHTGHGPSSTVAVESRYNPFFV